MSRPLRFVRRGVLAGALVLSSCDSGPRGSGEVDCGDEPVSLRSTEVLVAEMQPGVRREHRLTVTKGDSVALLPGTSLVALRGRLVDVVSGRVYATFRPMAEKPTGLAHGIVVVERSGGELRAPYRNLLVRTIPHHGSEALRTALTFVGLDGQERTLARDTLRFVASATFVRTRYDLPRGDRRSPDVLVVRTSEQCDLAFNNDDTLRSQTCDVTDRGLWRFPTDGAPAQRVAGLPPAGPVASHAPSANGQHDLVVLDTGMQATVVRIDLRTGQTDVHPRANVRQMALMADGVTGVGLTRDFATILDFRTGTTTSRTFRSLDASEPWRGIVADSGLVARGWRDFQNVGIHTDPVVGPPREIPRLGNRLFYTSEGTEGDSYYMGIFPDIRQVDLTPDGARYAMLIDRVRVPVCHV